MRFTLKARLTLAACLVVAMAIGTVALVQRGQIEADVRQIVSEGNDALAYSLARDLDVTLSLHLDLLDQVASLADAGQLATPSGREQFLVRLTAFASWFDGITLLGLDGGVLLNLPALAPGQRVNVADRAYFQQALQSTAPVVSEPLRSRIRNGPVVVLAKAIHDARHRPVAVLATELRLQRANILGSLNEHPVGKTGHIEVRTTSADGAEGIFVVHPEPAMLMAPAPRVVADGDWLVSSVALSTVPWELRVMLPQWEVRAPARQAQRRLLELLLGVGALAAALAWAGAVWLLRPLDHLTRTIRHLHDFPDAPLRLDTVSQDERGDLAREFQSLIATVREREQELAAVSAASPLGLFRTDGAGLITWVNDAFLRMHGLEASEKAKGWLLLVEPDKRELAWTTWCEAIARPEPLRVHMRMRLRSGVDRILDIRTAPVWREERLVGHAGAVTDVTDRAELERAQRVLARVLDATTDYVVQTDAKGQVTYMNPAVRRALDIGPDEPVQHRHFSEFNTPETNALYATAINPAVLAQGVWLGESTVLAALGRVVPVSHMVLAHRDKKGRIERYSAVMRDLTAKQAAALELQRQAATQAAMADAIPAVVAVVDAQQRYRFVNRAFEAWRGLPREQVVGHTLAEVLGPQDHARSLPWVLRVLDGEAVSFERDYANAGTSHLAVTYIPLRLADGTIDGFVGMAADISVHRRREAQLAERAERDPLTGLLNRAGFGERLARWLGEGCGPELALLYIDLDRFKPVNDTYGHPVGDQLLRQFAERVQAQVRPSDAVARLGGDEFAVALADIRDIDHARAVAQKILQAAHEPFEVNGHELRIGASVGLALGTTSEDGLDGLARRADEQLYAAKAAGWGVVRG